MSFELRSNNYFVVNTPCTLTWITFVPSSVDTVAFYEHGHMWQNDTRCDQNVQRNLPEYCMNIFTVSWTGLQMRPPVYIRGATFEIKGSAVLFAKPRNKKLIFHSKLTLKVVCLAREIKKCVKLIWFDKKMNRMSENEGCSQQDGMAKSSEWESTISRQIDDTTTPLFEESLSGAQSTAHLRYMTPQNTQLPSTRVMRITSREAALLSTEDWLFPKLCCLFPVKKRIELEEKTINVGVLLWAEISTEVQVSFGVCLLVLRRHTVMNPRKRFFFSFVTSSKQTTTTR